MQSPPRILVVDDELVPLFPHWQHVTTCEDAFVVLDDQTVDELWLRHDLPDAIGIATLVELLLNEEHWEGSKIDTVIIPMEDITVPETELEQQLKDHYPIRRIRITPELFAS